METVNLETTNLMLGIMAAVSVLEALLLIGIGIGGFIMYRRVTALVNDIEARHIAPIRERVDAILGEVQSVAARVSHQTERVDHAISGTMDRVDETAERVKTSVRGKVYQVIGMAQGIRAVLMALFQGRHEPMAGRWQSANR